MRYGLIDGGLSEAGAAAVVALLRDHVEEVSREAVKAIEAQVPEYVRPHDPRYAELLYQTVAWSNGRFIDLLEDDGVSLDDMLAFFREVGKGEAKEGRGQELWQKAFRIGTGVSIKRFTEVAQSRSGVSATAVAEVVQAVLSYQNQVMSALLEGHTQTSVRAAGDRALRQRRLVELLLTDAPDPDEIRERALDAQWALPKTVAAIAVHRRDGDLAHRPAIPADALPGLHLAEPCLIVADPDGPGRRQALESGLRGWLAVFGPSTDVTGAARSLAWGRRTLRLVLDGHVSGDEPVNAVDHIPLMLLMRDQDMVQYLAAERLAPLSAARGRQRRRLAETLLACLESSFNAPEVAVRLNLHPQTIRYRLRQLEALFGTGLYDPAGHLELQLALRYWLAINPSD